MATHRDDVRFMPDTFAAEVETLPIAMHAILWLTLVFFVTALVWANLANVDEVAHAQGRVIPSSKIQVVQNLEGGILSKVAVKAGEHVAKGQTLMRMDDTRFASSFNESKVNAFSLKARIARLEAEIARKPFVPPSDIPEGMQDLVDNELHLYDARERELQSALDILSQQLTQQKQALAELLAREQKLSANAELAKQELSMTEPLVKTGAVSQVELLRLQVAVNDSVGELEEVRHTIPKARAMVAEAEEKIAERKQQFNREAQSDLNDARTEFGRLTYSNLALEDRVNRTDVRSPVDGTVKQVLVNTVGAVIQPGMDLVEIVPSNDTLLIEARIRPADIAFIHPGQQATVKLTAYDFAIYGGLQAELEFISADTITDERGDQFFKIHVRTDKNHLGTDDNPLPIIPGMVATVDIMTGEKTVMDYLLKPLKRAQATALSER
ncbi:MAG: HlyD family type I secretion periplasmic adaptor subunit [Pseudomonadales bacterium]|nr:HlyD family type I secretion periplasmic adaptor subunit [Pseudomonadales bacterium]